MTDKQFEQIECLSKKLWGDINNGYEYSMVTYSEFLGIVTEVWEELQEEPVSEELEEKAAQLSQKYFPNEENIWARPNIEAQDCKNACIEMAQWQEQKDKEALNLYLKSQWNKGK